MQLFLSTVTSDNGGSGELQLQEVRGYNSQTHATTSTASGTSIQETISAGGTACVYLSRIYQPGTNITGNITGNLRGLESATSVNAGLGGLLEVVDAANSTVLATILSETGFPAVITELTTSDAAKALAATAVSAYNPAVPYRFRWTTKVKNVGTMGAGTVTTSVSGATAAAAGDSSITPPTTQTPWFDTSKVYPAAYGAPAVANAASVAVPIPSGVAAGTQRLMFLTVTWVGTGGTPTAGNITWPSGWADSGFGPLIFTDTPDSQRFGVYVGYINDTGSASGTETVSASTLSGAAVATMWGQEVRIAGALFSGGNPIDRLDYNANGNTGATDSTTVSASTVPSVDNSLILAYSLAWANSLAQPDGMTADRYDLNIGTFGFASEVSYRQQSIKAAPGSLVFRMAESGGASWLLGMVVTLKPGSLPELVMAPRIAA